MVRETEFCGLRLAGYFRRRMRENSRNSVADHALTRRNYGGFEVDGRKTECNLSDLLVRLRALTGCSRGGLRYRQRYPSLLRSRVLALSRRSRTTKFQATTTASRTPTVIIIFMNVSGAHSRSHNCPSPIAAPTEKGRRQSERSSSCVRLFDDDCRSVADNLCDAVHDFVGVVPHHQDRIGAVGVGVVAHHPV